MCRPIYLSKSRTEKLNCMPSWNYAHLYVLNVFCVICGLLAPLCYTLHVTLTVEKHAVMQFLCGHQPSQAALRWDDRWWGMAECSSGTRILVFIFLALAQRPKWSKGHGRFSIKIISAHEDQVPPIKQWPPNSILKKFIWATMLEETESLVRAGARARVGVSKTAEIGWKRDR